MRSRDPAARAARPSAPKTKEQSASAIFEYVEAFYNPRRRHSSICNVSPAEFEFRQTAEADAA
jgi:putative transposase